MRKSRKQSYTPRPLGQCYYCEERAFTVDHYVPISRGGTSNPRNLMPACFDCNAIKGNMLAEEFFWHCKELLTTPVQGLLSRDRKFLPKARKILSLLAPDLLAQVNA